MSWLVRIFPHASISHMTVVCYMSTRGQCSCTPSRRKCSIENAIFRIRRARQTPLRIKLSTIVILEKQTHKNNCVSWLMFGISLPRALIPVVSSVCFPFLPQKLRSCCFVSSLSSLPRFLHFVVKIHRALTLTSQ